MPSIVPITTPGGSYEVRIGRGLIKTAGLEIAKLVRGKKVAVIADANVAPLYSAALLESLREADFSTSLFEVPAGETSKDIPVYAQALSFLAQQKLDRESTVIALGGGVVGDLTGFVAASFLRGIHFVQIPTSLLAMVDSSVGGKTGVNLPEGKNLVGAFYQPRLVLADLDTLTTLPPRELAAGMAEVIKHGIIADPELFELLRAGTPVDLGPIVERNVRIKAAVVAADERETNEADPSGGRMKLNFGHTIGHAIEAAAGYGQLLHGEAVAIGIRAAAHLSHKLAGLPASDVAQIEAVLAANKLPLHFECATVEKLSHAMSLDKKSKLGSINWVLVPVIGQTVINRNVPAEAVAEVLEIIRTAP